MSKGYGLLNILFKSTFSLQYGHVCFFPTIHHPRMQNSWNLRGEVEEPKGTAGVCVCMCVCFSLSVDHINITGEQLKSSMS